MESKSEYFEQPIQKVAGWIIRKRILGKRILGERIWRIG